jgi:DNA-binding GntR family transcriptional regulator
MTLPRGPASPERPGAESHQTRTAIPSSTPDRVASAIVRGILMRQFKPGQRLTEAELTRSLGVGRSTVREAFRILSSSGVLELTPHRGAEIRTLTRADSQNLLEVMEVLAGLAARLAARNIAAGNNRARMEAVAQTLRAPHSARELANVLDERLDFYNAMFRIAANDEVNRALPLARGHLFRTQFHQYLTASDLRAMIGEYRRVADAILAGDERKAEQRMRKHIKRTGERTIPRLFQFAPDPVAHHGA